MSSVEIETFLSRAGDFSRGMKLLRDDQSYSQSAALLAIHSAIAYADALRVGLGDSRLSSEDHQTAPQALRNQLRSGEDLSGIGRYGKLLAEKSAIAYGSKRFDTQKLQLLCIESERFALWANKIATQTPVAGWSVDRD